MQKEDQIPENFENRLDEFASELFSISKENPFNVPADYFDSFPEKVIAKCTVTKKENSFYHKFRVLLNPKIYVPLAISIIVVLILVNRSSELNTMDTQQLAYMENSAEYQYVDSLIENGEMDESLLLETIAGIDDTSKSSKDNSAFETDITDLNNSTVILIDTINNITITDDDIIQYLIDNDDDDDLINY